MWKVFVFGVFLVRIFPYSYWIPINHHCVKSIRIRSFSGPYFSAFGPYSVWMRKNTDQKNSEYEHFSRSDGLLELQNIVTLKSEKASWKWTEERRSRRLWNKIWVCQINCDTTLEEDKVINPDGISDYITKDHFDGHQIILSLSKLLKRNINNRYFNYFRFEFHSLIFFKSVLTFWPNSASLFL